MQPVAQLVGTRVDVPLTVIAVRGVGHVAGGRSAGIDADGIDYVGAGAFLSFAGESDICLYI